MVNYFRMDGWVKTSQGPAIPGAQIYVCTQPANVASLPPSPLGNIFSDPNGLVPITQPILTDGFGHYNFYAQAAAYTIVVGFAGQVQEVYPDQSVGAASGSSGGGGGTALALQVNGVPNVDQLLLNIAGAGSITAVDNGSGTVTITGTVFKTNGVTNISQATVNLIAGSGISIASDSSGDVTVSFTGSSTVAPGQNVMQCPSWGGTTVYPQNGQWMETFNISTSTIFEGMSSGILLCQPSNWKVTIGTISSSTQVTMVVIKCTRGTGTVLSTAPVKFGGSSTPTLTPAGLHQSDSINFPFVSGFDYYFALNTSTGFIAGVAPGNNQAGLSGGTQVTASNALPIGSSLPSWIGSNPENSNHFIFDLVSA